MAPRRNSKKSVVGGCPLRVFENGRVCSQNIQNTRCFNGVTTMARSQSLSLIFALLAFRLTPRLWLTRQIWQRINENEIVITSSSVKSSSIYNKANINKHASMKHVVATTKQYSHLESIKNTNSTKMTYVAQIDLGGFIPRQLVSRAAVSFLSDYPVERKHFSR